MIGTNLGMLTEKVKLDDIQIVQVTEKQKEKLEAQVFSGGPQVRTLDVYIQEYNTSFQYKFVAPLELTKEERQIFESTQKILALVGQSIASVPTIRISETMRVTSDDTEGVWDQDLKAIVIKRSRLASLINYAATLLHEVGHATTKTQDTTREFENVLTGYLGQTSVVALKR
jgi:hypothetical protein